MSTETLPPKEVPAEAKALAEAFKMDVAETFKELMKEPEKKIDPTPIEQPPESNSLAEIIARQKAAPVAPVVPAATATTAAPPVAPAAPAAPAPEPVKVVATSTDTLRGELQKLDAKIDAMRPAAPAAPAAAAPEPDDADYIETLTEEQKEEIELARFAAEQNPDRYKEQPKKFVDFYKKLDEYVKANPEADKEAVDQFILDNRPKWQGNDRRKIDMALVTQKAEERVEARLKPVLEKTQQRVHELETRPAVNAAHSKFVQTMEEGQIKVPEGVPMIDKEVVQAVKQGGEMELIDGIPVPKAALKKHRVEAVPVAKAMALSKEFLDLRANLSTYDLSRPTCYKVAEFLNAQSNNFLQRPVEQRTLPDGRTFAHYLEFSGMKPEERAKHFTFTDEQVLAMFGTHAALEIHGELKTLQESGFTRVVVPKPAPNGQPAPVVPAPVPTTATAPVSPVFGGGGGSMPGAAVTTPGEKSYAEDFKRLGLPVPT